jgi:hypothetical protein
MIPNLPTTRKAHHMHTTHTPSHLHLLLLLIQHFGFALVDRAISARLGVLAQRAGDLSGAGTRGGGTDHRGRVVGGRRGGKVAACRWTSDDGRGSRCFGDGDAWVEGV